MSGTASSVRSRACALMVSAAVVAALGVAPGADASWTGYSDSDLNVYAGPDPFLMLTPTIAISNVGVGAHVLTDTTDGSANLGAGAAALNSNTTGSGNVAAGASTLALNTSGSYNVAA